MTASFNAYDREAVDYADPHFRMNIWSIDHKSPASEEYGPWHYHEAVEWIAVLKGTMAIETTNHDYPLQGGDVMLLGSNELHRSRKYGPSELVYIVCHVDMGAFMDPSLLTYYAAFTGKSANLTMLNEPLGRSVSKGQAHALLARMLQDSTAKKRGYELAVNASFKMLLHTLIQIDERKVIAPMDPHLAEKLRPALALIEQRLETSCLIADISRELNYNGGYFAKLFKRGMGMTFTSYVQMRRMKRAAQLLLTVTWSVTEISGSVGFASPAQFYQLFRRHFGCSPKQFAGRHGRDNGSIGEYS
ncbi:AraC family transcriptional regulator [Paenibacillus glycinis]|uniref:Helix-turn-helix domain-containing protein n=1 Tax=Paenibacillus glycinis TaxID=2697035 RepID=A0ABW9XZP3_9BACL|nr:AraC family transcriptional regulator [Paenibacillus glycinis]NBD27888.1 helix-turn-helix domain-containing protein [Paenibacillus glycinis]